LRLRCAVCGRGKLFRGWFRMKEKCDHCGAKFDPGGGYYLGSIYFNYGVTAVIVVACYLILFLTRWVSPEKLFWGLAIFCLAFPLWFFRYARSLWFGFDHYWDPMDQR